MHLIFEGVYLLKIPQLSSLCVSSFKMDDLLKSSHDVHE